MLAGERLAVAGARRAGPSARTTRLASVAAWGSSAASLTASAPRWGSTLHARFSPTVTSSLTPNGHAAPREPLAIRLLMQRRTSRRRPCSAARCPTVPRRRRRPAAGARRRSSIASRIRPMRCQVWPPSSSGRGGRADRTPAAHSPSSGRMPKNEPSYGRRQLVPGLAGVVGAIEMAGLGRDVEPRARRHRRCG